MGASASMGTPRERSDLAPEDGWSSFPRLGLRLSAYADFVQSCGGQEELRGLSTVDVFEKFIRPRAADKDVSYCELLRAGGVGAVGVASVYVIHTWSSPFLATMAALMEHFRHTPDMIIWMDIFSVNQSRGMSLKNIDLQRGMEHLGRAVLVADPSRPVPLSRTWCLYEIMCSALAHCSLELAFSAEDRGRVALDLANGKKVVAKFTQDIDFLASRATLREDREVLLGLVEDGLGADEAAALASRALRGALIDVCKAAGQACVGDPRSHLCLLNTLGELLVLQGKLFPAEGVYLDYLMESKAQLGAQHPSTLRAMGLLVALFQRDGRPDLAELVGKLYRQCVEEGESCSGMAKLFIEMHKYEQAESMLVETLSKIRLQKDVRSPELLTAMDALIGVYVASARHKEAEELLMLTLPAKRAQLGDAHAQVLQDTHTLVGVLCAQGQLYKAESVLTGTIAALQERCGPENDSESEDEDTLGFLHSLASLYLTMGRMDRAEPLLQLCHTKCLDRYGAEHHNTLSAMNDLAVFYYRQGEFARAEPLLTKCLATRREVFGEKHPDTLDVMSNLAGLYAAMVAQAR